MVKTETHIQQPTSRAFLTMIKLKLNKIIQEKFVEILIIFETIPRKFNQSLYTKSHDCFTKVLLNGKTESSFRRGLAAIAADWQQKRDFTCHIFGVESYMKQDSFEGVNHRKLAVNAAIW